MGLLTFIPILVNALFVLLSLSNGMMYTIDATNTYHRGPYFFLVAIWSLLYVIGAQLHLFRQRKLVKKEKFPFIIAYPFPVVIGSILQVHMPEMQILGVSFAVTLLMAFLHIQNSHANRDYLTFLYNRSLGEQYLQYLYQHKREGKLIGGIMMDINGFKVINDTYGHDLGDKALRLFAKALRESFSREWLICRYGGDEFLVFCELESSKASEEALMRFEMDLALFNRRKELPIPLSVSVGHDVVDDSFEGDWISFLKTLDDKMYANKEQYHTQRPNLEEGDTIS